MITNLLGSDRSDSNDRHNSTTTSAIATTVPQLSPVENQTCGQKRSLVRRSRYWLLETIKFTTQSNFVCLSYQYHTNRSRGRDCS